MAQLTRREIETRLEEKYLGRVISIELPMLPYAQGVYMAKGKVQRISVDTKDTEPMVVFLLAPQHLHYQADINYFIENTTIHGDPH